MNLNFSAGSAVFFKPVSNAEEHAAHIMSESKPEGTVAQNFHGGSFAEEFFTGNTERTLRSNL